MKNLVERLRNDFDQDWKTNLNDETLYVIQTYEIERHQAADEIERLQRHIALRDKVIKAHEARAVLPPPINPEMVLGLEVVVDPGTPDGDMTTTMTVQRNTDGSIHVLDIEQHEEPEKRK